MFRRRTQSQGEPVPNTREAVSVERSENKTDVQERETSVGGASGSNIKASGEEPEEDEPSGARSDRKAAVESKNPSFFDEERRRRWDEDEIRLREAIREFEAWAAEWPASNSEGREVVRRLAAENSPRTGGLIWPRATASLDT